jgi:Family of unknown function (DUF6067)
MKNCLSLFACLFICSASLSAQKSQDGARIAAGEFTASRFSKAPTIDGKVTDGEWDEALTTSGMITPFDLELQQAATTVSMGFDEERFFFLFRCVRGDGEWKLWKKARLNDDYNFAEPSVEVWVTPPSDIPETFQNILNTYPAVFDQQQIPSRGYSAQGWKADWKVAESETDAEYIIEASVPIKDFGFAGVKNGDIWRFLLARNAPGALPRPQASWSITTGFAELPQHPPVRLMDQSPVLQLRGVPSILSGKYQFDISLVAPKSNDATADIEVRFQKAITPAADDKVEVRKVTAKAGSHESVTFSGDATAMASGFFTVKATLADGTQIFRQNFPFKVTGWVPKLPTRPDKAPVPSEVEISAQFGPETSTVLVKTDILDFPKRDQVASAEVKVLDSATGKTLASGPMRPFVQSYGEATLHIPAELVPVNDFSKVQELKLKNRDIGSRNKALKESRENPNRKPGDPAPGPDATPEPLLEIPKPLPLKARVMVTLKDASGAELHSASQDLDLLRYAADWMNNKVGITDKVIPPYTPVKVAGADVGVWNRTLSLDGLGLATQVINGGVKQLAAPMRLVAVKDGQEIPVQAKTPKLTRQVENQADFTGSAQAAGLKFEVRTKVEFDGFVLNNLEITAADGKPTSVDKLFLEIELPADLASHFCTTAGGWAAVHDALPDHWTSQSTSSGMLIGDFVPYIWLTDSEHGFLWFADSDKGWNHDPDKSLPTQEITRKDGKVILRVNFFEIPTTVDAPRTITWGWQTFPARPLKPGWRATFCASSPPIEQTTNSYFWTDADWAVLWPYYCSPFAWNFETSRQLMQQAAKNPIHRPMPGSIAHSIGRYQDYDWNMFPGLAVDWGATPGENSNANVTASRGPNDFRLWHYQRWVKEGDLKGLYVDENYIALEDNYLTGNAYWRPDGLLQRAYNYIGLREYFKRLKVMFHENKVPEPNLWQHISSGAAYYAWPGDIFFEGENVEPTNLQYDYIEVLPAGRLRAIGSSVASGGIMTMMMQSQRHRTEWSAKHNHQFVGWVMAHDILPEQSQLYVALVEAAHLWEADIKFLPYWKPSPFTTNAADCLVSAHQGPERTLLWVVNKGRKDAGVPVKIDWKAAGLDPKKVVVFNAETGEQIAHNAEGLSVNVLQRDFVPVLIAPLGTAAPKPFLDPNAQN